MNKVYFTNGETHTVTVDEDGTFIVWDKERQRFFTALFEEDADGNQVDYFDTDESDELEHSQS